MSWRRARNAEVATAHLRQQLKLKLKHNRKHLCLFLSLRAPLTRAHIHAHAYAIAMDLGDEGSSPWGGAYSHGTPTKARHVPNSAQMYLHNRPRRKAQPKTSTQNPVWPAHRTRRPCLTACRVSRLLQSFREHRPGCLCRIALPSSCTRPSKAAVRSAANSSGGCRGSSGPAGGTDTPRRTRSTPGASAKGAHSIAGFSPDYIHARIVASGYDGLGQPR
jgi:hypothetical protein